jgi:hypothetical protein
MYYRQGVFMVSKKELEKQVRDKELEVEKWMAEVHKRNSTIKDQANKIIRLSLKANLNQTIFLTANVDAYPTKEARDEALDHVRERMDNELERLKIPAQSVLLPDIVTNIHVHEMKG